MTLLDMRNRSYVHTRDFKRERFDPLLVDALLNEAQEEFNAQTGLHTVRTQVTITSGAGDLVETLESETPGGGVAIQGEILRVEDAGNNNKFLARTSEEVLDILKGPTWRDDTAGPLQFWMRGRANEGTQTGYETILVYPVMASRTINVFYVKRPPELVGDADVSVLPRHYHMALVWHAVGALLSDAALQEDAGKITSANARYGAYLERAKAEADKALRWR